MTLLKKFRAPPDQGRSPMIWTQKEEQDAQTRQAMEKIRPVPRCRCGSGRCRSLREGFFMEEENYQPPDGASIPDPLRVDGQSAGSAGVLTIPQRTDEGHQARPEGLHDVGDCSARVSGVNPIKGQRRQAGPPLRYQAATENRPPDSFRRPFLRRQQQRHPGRVGPTGEGGRQGPFRRRSVGGHANRQREAGVFGKGNRWRSAAHTAGRAARDASSSPGRTTPSHPKRRRAPSKQPSSPANERPARAPRQAASNSRKASVRSTTDRSRGRGGHSATARRARTAAPMDPSRPGAPRRARQWRQRRASARRAGPAQTPRVYLRCRDPPVVAPIVAAGQVGQSRRVGRPEPHRLDRARGRHTPPIDLSFQALRVRRSDKPASRRDTSSFPEGTRGPPPRARRRGPVTAF